MEHNRENIEPGNKSYQDDEISLKELIEKGKALFTYFMGYKWVIVAAGLLGGGLGFGYAHFTKVVLYESKLTFTVEGANSSGGGAMLGLASQFGLNVGGSGSSSLFVGENLYALLKSNKIIQGSLLRPMDEIPHGNLLNYYLNMTKKESLKDGSITYFPLELERKSYTRSQDSLLAVITEGLKVNIKVSNEDKKVTISQLTVISSDEYFCWKLTNLLIEEASKLYLDLKVGKMKRSVEILQQRVDSVQRILNSSMLSAAVEIDRSLGLVSQAPKVNSAKMQMNTQMLGILYGELTKNLEMTKFSLSQQEPIIEIIDPSVRPLNKIGKGRVKSGFFWGLISSFSILFYLSIKKLISNLK
jgi:hypothetical protein